MQDFKKILWKIAADLTWYQWAFLGLLCMVSVFFGIWFLRYLHRKKESADLVHLKITLPRNDSKLDNEKRTEKDFHEQIGKAEQLFRALHETRDMNLYNILAKRTIWGKPMISFELQFERRELSFVVVCDPYYQKIIQKQITSFYDSAEVEVVPKEKRMDLDEKGYKTNGYFMFLRRGYWYPIQTYKQIEDDPLNIVSNAFSKLEKTEKAAIQIVIHPIGDRWQKKAQKKGTAMFKGKKDWGINIPILGPVLSVLWMPFKILFTGYDAETDSIGNNAPGAKDGDSYVRMLQSDEEIAKSIGEKSIQSGFDCVVRVMASSQEGEVRVQDILNGIFVAFNAFKGKGRNFLQNRRIFFLNGVNAPIMKHNFRHRLSAFLERRSLLVPEELSTMYHFPDARYNKIPTIKWLDYKVLPPPINLPIEGITLGNSVYRGIVKPVKFMREDRTRHCYIIGKSGSGKSVLLWNMAVQDIEQNEGVCVIDPHGDLIEDCLQCIPKERAKDVVVFDPSDSERPMGLNMLEAKTPEQQDRASLDAMEIFIKLFGNEIFGPRIQHYFRNGCLTLMADQDEGATLIDIPRLFIDDDFQRYKVSKVRNPVVRAFWEHEMAQTGDREKQEMIPYFTSKFGPFVTNTTMRNIIGQTKSAFNIREMMDDGKILLVNLSKGKIGSINAQLLGLIFVSKINQAAMGRVDIPARDRKDFYFYVDEFQNFATDTFATILSEARKYRLNLTMAHQYIAQLTESPGGVAIGQKDSKIRDAVFGNVGTMVSFKVGADDAEYLEKEYAPVLSQQDILSISNYKAYLKLNINNSPSRPFSMETIYEPEKKSEKIADIIKRYSRVKHGRKKEFVDAEIEARLGIGQSEAVDKMLESMPEDESAIIDPNNIPEVVKTLDKSAIVVPSIHTDHAMVKDTRFVAGENFKNSDQEDKVTDTDA
ncbi:MAG TPA: type IV secretory system conjugative DNA transfer family protein [Candidatus Gracilibacteria bacterium]